jgi:hypothetical protein
VYQEECAIFRENVPCVISHRHNQTNLHAKSSNDIKNFPSFLVLGVSLPCLHKPATGPYSEPHESIPHPHKRDLGEGGKGGNLSSPIFFLPKDSFLLATELKTGK